MAEALHQTFDTCKEWLMDSFANKFTPKDSNYVNPSAFKEFGDMMLMHYEYGAQQEAFLINQTKFYIRTILDRSQSHNVSVDFLEKLLNKVAAHLSYYVMNKYEIPESGKSKNKLRIRVQAEIKDALFNENPYIAMLKQKQADNRAFRSKTKQERAKTISERHRRDAAAAYNQARQIKKLFNDAQNTPRKQY